MMDIFNMLNKLNLNLQGANKDIFQTQDFVRAFSSEVKSSSSENMQL